MVNQLGDFDWIKFIRSKQQFYFSFIYDGNIHHNTEKMERK